MEEPIVIIPEGILSILNEKGILAEHIRAGVKLDMSRDQIYCDSYLVATDEDLVILDVINSLKRKKKRFFFSKYPEKSVNVLGYRHIPIKGLHRFRVEEQIATCRITALDGDGNDLLLGYCSYSCKARACDFCDGMTPGADKGEKKPRHRSKDKPPVLGDEDICPKCGRRYADPKRKICAHCIGKGRLAKKLLPFVKRYKFQMALVLLTIALTTGLNLLAPYVSQKIFYDDVLAENGSLYGRVGLALVIMIGARLLSAFVSMINGIINGKVSANVTYDLKKTIFSSFGRLSLSFFTARQTGGLMTQVNSDATTIYWFFCDGIPYFLTNVLQLIGIVILLFSLSPIMTLSMIAIIPLFGVFYFFSMRMFKKLYARNYAKRRSVNSIISDVITGFRVVKVFSRGERENERFDKRSDDFAESTFKVQIKENTVFPAFNFLIQIVSYVIWFVGGILVVRGAAGESTFGITYGTLMIFVSYISMVYDPIRFLAEFSGRWADCFNALQRLFEVMDASSDIAEKEDPVILGDVKGIIDFDHVSFSYEKNRKTIDDVSFHVDAGETLGIVGHTGAGKSTLINLLTRLYDVSSGSIMIDGVDVRDMSLAELHRNTAIVSQETFLFRGSMLDNIRYARPDATEDEVIEAAKLAGAHSFIIKYPDGYNTMIGQNNIELSGGEKQRVSIARAILKDPRILILDEATAAMDTQTERHIQAAISEISKGRTTIMIAHRLSTLKDATKLVVIENGKMTEMGTHSELIKKKGSYFGLYKMQLEALKTIGIEE